MLQISGSSDNINHSSIEPEEYEWVELIRKYDNRIAENLAICYEFAKVLFANCL